jgi:drug/metabolite transporter (DMT)-like permease
MAVACLFWAALESAGRLISGRVSPFQLVWVRYAAHLAWMVVLLRPRRFWQTARTRKPALQIGRGLLMLGMPSLFVAGLAFQPAGAVWAVFWIAPWLVIWIAAFLLKARGGPLTWLAAAAGLVGAWMIYRPPAAIDASLLLPLGMAACFSLYFVLTRLLRDEGTMTNLFYTAVAVLAPLSLALPLFWRPLSLRNGLVMTAIGLLGWLSLYALDKALEHNDPLSLAPLLFQVPVWQVLLELIVFREPIDPPVLAGAALALLACLLCLRTSVQGSPYLRA